MSLTKKKPYSKMIILGIISASLYILLLSRQEFVTQYFAKGGINAFLPIITAFIFSFVHGSFTGSFWTVLGVEAAKKKKEAQ
ncbi:MAG: hypothetical protein HY809_01265 [Nitrospirae bacterium]|nr:hypothetical protein [Nitrospirota bacterium]